VVFGGVVVLPVLAPGVVAAELVAAAGGGMPVSGPLCEAGASLPPQPAPSQSRALNTSDVRARVVMGFTPGVSIIRADPRRWRTDEPTTSLPSNVRNARFCKHST
jgi:hypothetical protein